MKVDLKSSSGLIVAILIVAVLAAAFWILLLKPKRDEAAKLDAQVSLVGEELAQHRAEADAAAQARTEFPVNYQQLVVLGKAVPGDDDTASLLVQLNRIADRAGVRFEKLTLEEGGEVAPVEPTSTTSGTDPASLPSPTEVAASTLPLGAAIGPAGLAVMPYSLNFTGDFFQMADFINGLDTLVRTENEEVEVTGRLITIDGFSLEPDQTFGFPRLAATFSVTTFVTPPEEGVTAGATLSAPATVEGTPTATTTEGAP